MIAVDTNVLVRVLTQDDAREARAAEAVLRDSRERDEPVLVTLPVLCELEWVLETNYGVPRAEFADVVQRFLDDRALVVSDRDRVVEALAHYRDTTADLSDCLIATLARHAGARATVTFDRRMRRIPGCVVLRARTRR